jgi:hypothetical protein
MVPQVLAADYKSKQKKSVLANSQPGPDECGPRAVAADAVACELPAFSTPIIPRLKERKHRGLERFIDLLKLDRGH